MQGDDTARKPCKVCGTVKPLAEFHRNSRIKDGRSNRCKECAKARARAWRAENPERKRATSRAWYEANRSRVAQASAAWREANPEAHRESRRRAKRKLKEERPLVYMVRARLERKKLPIPPEAIDYAIVLTRDPCSYCGGEAGPLDHIVPTTAGGTNAWDNLTAACLSCNSKKGREPLLHALLAMYVSGGMSR